MTTSKIATALGLLATGVLPALAGESYDVNGAMGSLYYEYDFDVPAARGRYKPRLFLRYGGKQGQIGSNAATWGVLPVPLIRYEYVNIDPPYDYQQVYRYVDGENPDKILLPSLRDGAGHYNVDTEEEYMDFWRFDANAWCARDATGNMYRFESSSPDIFPATYGLKQVVDPDGNVTSYTYDSVNYVASIKYNIYGAQPQPPTDCRVVTEQFATELAIEYQGFVQNIRVKNACPVSATCPSGQVTVRRYGFAYTPITWTWHLDHWPWSVTYTISVLSTVTEFGGENGVARPPMRFEYAQLGNDQDPSVKEAHLAKVTTPLGAQRVIYWRDSSQFGDSATHDYPVVKSITTTGPGLATQSIDYGYAGVMPPLTGYFVQSYFPPKEFRGFSESWATDSTSGIVKHSWWETGSHAFVGREARIEYGALVTPESFPTLTSYTPPTSTVFRTEVFENAVRSITTAGATPTCTVPQNVAGKPGRFATEVPSGSYPVLAFQQKEQLIRQVDAVQLSSERTSACADVDTWGNLTRISVVPDTTGDVYVENASFEVAFDPAAICKDCVREQTRTDPTKLPPSDRLEATYFSYSPTFQLTAMYRQVLPVLNPTSYLGTSYYPRVSSSAPNLDGTLASQTEGAVTTTYSYDAYRLRPEIVSVADLSHPLIQMSPNTSRRVAC